MRAHLVPSLILALAVALACGWSLDPRPSAPVVEGTEVAPPPPIDVVEPRVEREVAVTVPSREKVRSEPPLGQASPAPEALPSAGSVVLPRAELERALADVRSVGDVVGVRPHVTLGGMDGVEITSIPRGSPVARLGLRVGDVVHSINGHPLSSISGAMAAAGRLANASSYQGVITRGGARQRLVVELR